MSRAQSSSAERPRLFLRLFRRRGRWLTQAFGLTLLASCVVWSLGGCKRGARHGEDEYTLAPVSRNHDLLAGTFTWASPEMSLAHTAAVAAKLGLPFGAADLESALRAQAPYPAAWDQIDWTKPLAVVVLALPATQNDGGASSGPKRVGSVAAFTPRPGGPATAMAWAPSFGAVVERRQEAVAVAAAGRDGGATSAGSGSSHAGTDALPEMLYLLVRDGALLVADSWTSLTQGGALALAARQTEGAGPTLSLRPAGIAKIQGTRSCTRRPKSTPRHLRRFALSSTT
jgi:hypothetical protein